jgi:hypothetical protein
MSKCRTGAAQVVDRSCGVARTRTPDAGHLNLHNHNGCIHKPQVTPPHAAQVACSCRHSMWDTSVDRQARWWCPLPKLAPLCSMCLELLAMAAQEHRTQLPYQIRCPLGQTCALEWLGLLPISAAAAAAAAAVPVSTSQPGGRPHPGCKPRCRASRRSITPITATYRSVLLPVLCAG